MTTVSFRINRKHIRSALFFAGKQDIRKDLNGVCVEVFKSGVFLVATDGHRLGVFKESFPNNDGPEKPAQFVIPRTLAATVKVGHLDTVGITYDPVSTTILIDDCGEVCSEKEPAGRFPEWRRVLPRYFRGELAEFDCEQIGDLAKAAKALGIRNHRRLRIHHNGTTPAGISIDDYPAFRGCLVPLNLMGSLPVFSSGWAEFPVTEPTAALLAA